MKKFTIIILALAFLVCGFSAVGSANVPIAEDAVPPTLLTAEVTLINKERIEHGFRLHVILPDGELAVYAPIHGQFTNRTNNGVTPEVFLSSYRGRRIFIDFIELSEDYFMVLEARGR